MKEILKTLTIKALHIESVKLSDKVSLVDNKLFINRKINFLNYKDIKDAKISIIKPNNRNVRVNSILDIIPISVKAYGVLGTGVTNTLTGVYVLLTSTVDNKMQLKNFGSCHGILEDIVIKNRIGSFTDNDYLIHIDVSIKNDNNLKNSIFNVHMITDDYISEIRKVLKEYDGTKFTESHTFDEKYNKNGKRVVLLKQVSGQGAMENNILLPDEPSGIRGGKSIMEYSNTPIIISPNEYRDGAIRAMT